MLEQNIHPTQYVMEELVHLIADGKQRKRVLAKGQGKV